MSRPTIMAAREAVSSGHYLATAAGIEILAAGGNAVDAGIAAGLALGVIESTYVSVAGVAPIIVRMADDPRVLTIAGVGGWPRAVSCDDLRARFGDDIPPGVLRTVVPAAPAAWLLALERFGTMSLAEVAASAIRHARDGFPVYPTFRRTIEQAHASIAARPSSAAVYLPDGALPAVGTLFRQPALAGTLQHLVDEEGAGAVNGRAAGIASARDAFYRGDVGRTLVDFIQGEGGLLAMDDLAAFTLEVEDAVTVRFRDVDVYGCGAWCQGPMLLQAIKIVDRLGLADLAHNSLPYVHLVTEALRLAARDRESYLGDPQFVSVDLVRLLSDSHAAALAGVVRADAALDPWPAPAKLAAAGEGADRLDLDTSFVSVVDRDGNAFAATPSDGCANAPVVPALGFVASPRGDQSWTDPRHPSCVAPGKRPRLTPNPAIAFKEGEFVMPFGTPGHDTQAQVMLQVLLNLVQFEMTPQEAVEAPRIASLDFPSSAAPHNVRPGLLYVEGEAGDALIPGLRALGHDARTWPSSGPDYFENLSAACLVRADSTSGVISAAADPRRPAYAIGR